MFKALHSRAGEKPVEVTEAAEIARLQASGEGCLWLDLEAPDDRDLGLLTRVFGFHRLAIENCLAAASHPRIDDYGGYLYLVFHGVSATREGLLTGKSRFSVAEMDVFLGPRFLVTFHGGPVPAIAALRRRCLEVDDAMRRGPDRLLAELLDQMADEFVDLMERIDDEVDAMEERLFHQAGRPALREIFSLRKDVLRLRRIVNPQREVLHRLARTEHPTVSREEALYFRDVYDHIYRVSEMLESFRDVLGGAMEVYLTMVANRTNEIMRVLTVFSLILMSASLIAGVYGMNVALPGAGRPWGFAAILGAMLLSSGILIVVFRRRRWL
jgi:magnesium transporter